MKKKIDPYACSQNNFKMRQPFNPESDRDLIAPRSIIAESDIKVMWQNECQHKKLVIVKQILLVKMVGNVRGQYGENTYWCHDVKGQRKIKGKMTQA